MADPSKLLLSKAQRGALKKGFQRLRLSFLKRRIPEAIYSGDPFRQVLIDPWAIRLVLRNAEDIYFPGFVKKNSRGHLSRHYTAGFVVGGDWHRHALPYRPEASPLFAALAARYHGAQEWENTEFFQVVMEKIKLGEPTWNRCRSAEDVMRQCRSTDRLIESIKRNGFGITSNPVIVSIGPGGEYIKSGNGRHRIMLGLISGSKVPVQINLRHSDYVEGLLRHASVGPVYHENLASAVPAPALLLEKADSEQEFRGRYT